MLPRRLRKTGVRFGVKFLLRSFLLAFHQHTVKFSALDTALVHDVSREGGNLLLSGTVVFIIPSNISSFLIG